MLKAFVAVAGVAAESFTWTVNDTVPAVLGVPEITPVEAAKDKPVGSEPTVRLQL